MPEIFSSLNEFPSQSKKEWIEKFLSEKKTNKIKDIQHKINNRFFDPIYFNSEVKEKNTFFKKKGWRICANVLVDKIKNANKKAITAVSEGSNSICFDLNNKQISKKQINSLLKNINFKKINIEFQNCKNSKIILKYLTEQKEKNAT